MSYRLPELLRDIYRTFDLKMEDRTADEFIIQIPTQLRVQKKLTVSGSSTSSNPIFREHSKMLAPLEPASAENCTCQLSSYHVRIT